MSDQLTSILKDPKVKDWFKRFWHRIREIRESELSRKEREGAKLDAREWMCNARTSLRERYSNVLRWSFLPRLPQPLTCPRFMYQPL